jgi:two-component system, LytTR family, response regulator AlgR
MNAVSALRVLIVDDESLARLRLRQLVGECAEPRAVVAGEARDAAQALAWLEAHDCDVLLLDVQMPGADGTQLAALLHARARPPAIVFVTAHAQHAVKAFELEALDYLTKPVRRERLQAALQRVARRLALPSAAADGAAGDAPVIVVNDRGRVTRVPLSEVLYLKAELKYVTLRTARHTHVLDEPLADLEARLGERFLRVHRNALVARRAVRALERRVLAGEGDDESGEGWAVRVEGLDDEWLAVSRRQLGAVREALLDQGL